MDELAPPEQEEGVVEETEESSEASAGARAAATGGTSTSQSDSIIVNYDKELRKLIGSMEMNFNSGVANLKKALDDLKDAPQLLPGKSPGLVSLLSNTELKLKRDVLSLKRKLMDIGKAKEEL